MNKTLQLKSARKMIKGLQISWTDPNPLAESPFIQKGIVTHKNPIYRLTVNHVWRDFAPWIMQQPGLLWLVDFTVVFRYPNGRDQLESRRIIENMRLHDLATACEPIIKEAMRYGANPIETRFIVQCLGQRQKQESDYDDYQPTHNEAA